MAEALFEFDDVEVRFADRVALDGVSVDVPDEGVTVLLGPSGSGKSTMLRLCNRLEVPTAGEVRFRGRPVREIDPLSLRRRVGMVFQRPTLFPGTVEDNLRVAAPDATAEDLRRALDRAALGEGFLPRVADDLSGGEAQRACLARTLITDPEVLLMDEPTSALDPTATRQLERLAREVSHTGTPVLWVTHDLAQADRIADARIVLSEGRVADEHARVHFERDEPSDHAHGGAHDDHAHGEGGEPDARG